MGKGDISQEHYDEIIHLCIRCSQGSTCGGATSRDPISRGSKPHSVGITWMEIGNLLDYFKMDILGTLTTHLDVLQAKQKQALTEQNLVIFCPRCRKKLSQWEFPLDMVKTCTIYNKDHDTEQCPSLPVLKVVFKEEEEETELVCLMNQCREWQAKPTSMSQGAPQFFPFL